jgi:hypothetical protein
VLPESNDRGEGVGAGVGACSRAFMADLAHCTIAFDASSSVLAPLLGRELGFATTSAGCFLLESRGFSSALNDAGWNN